MERKKTSNIHMLPAMYHVPFPLLPQRGHFGRARSKKEKKKGYTCQAEYPQGGESDHHHHHLTTTLLLLSLPCLLQRCHTSNTFWFCWARCWLISESPFWRELSSLWRSSKSAIAPPAPLVRLALTIPLSPLLPNSAPNEESCRRNGRGCSDRSGVNELASGWDTYTGTKEGERERKRGERGKEKAENIIG